jgi:hypothetical protein
MRKVVAIVLCTGAGCAEGLSGPDAPPLDILGRYEVEWFVRYTRPDGKEDFTLPHGTCPGVVVIARQGKDSFSGTVTTPNDQLPICRAGTFAIHGALSRYYFVTSNNTVINYYDMNFESDLEPLFGCRYQSKAPGDEQYPFRGAGQVRQNRQDVVLRIAFSNVYSCGSARWVITAGANGARRTG